MRRAALIGALGAIILSCQAGLGADPNQGLPEKFNWKPEHKIISGNAKASDIIERMGKVTPGLNSKTQRMDLQNELLSVVSENSVPLTKPDLEYIRLRDRFGRSDKKYKKFLNSPAGNGSFDMFLKHVPPLKKPLGKMLPIFVWHAPIPTGRSPEVYFKACMDRGIMPLLFIEDPETVELERPYFEALKKLNYPIAILGSHWGNRSATGLVPKNSHKDCLGMWERFLAEEKAMTESIVAKFKELDIKVDFVFLDWEKWTRIRENEVAGDKFRALYKACKACKICQKNLPPEYLATEDGFIRGTEIIRGKVSKEAFVDPVLAYNPQAVVGNYYATSHCPQDGPLPARPNRATGWYKSGWNISQSVLYSRYFWHMENPKTVGWNVFKHMIDELSMNAKIAPHVPQMPWTKNWMLDFARRMVPQADGSYKLAGSKRVHYPMKEEDYKEFLLHSLLRGADTFCLWLSLVNHTRVIDGEVNIYTEINNHKAALEEMAEHYDVIYHGTPMNVEPTPGEFESLEGAFVWSGSATDTKAVIRTKSFTGKEEKVTVNVFGEEKTLSCFPQGKTYVFTKGQ